MRVPYVVRFWRFHVAFRWAELCERATWKIAWLIPRKIALRVFIRVYSASGDAPTSEYARIYRAWEAGAGQ